MISFAISEEERETALSQLKKTEERFKAAAEEAKELLELLESEYLSVSAGLQKRLESHTTEICSYMFKIRVQRCKLKGQNREIS
jgi:hypothetical protein